MLIERVFLIGAILCGILGAWLLYELPATGWQYYSLGEAGALCLVFALLLASVGRAAQRQRRQLLRLGESGPEDPLPTRGRP